MLEKPLSWLGSSLEDLRAFPADARRNAGHELGRVQQGLLPTDWKPMTAVGEGVIEIRVHTRVEHRVFYVPEPTSGRRLRIAIDPSSRDFERLTELEFADVDAELVPLNYLRSVRAMADGTIDAAILDSEDALMHFPPGLANRSLSERVRTELGGANLEAAFVGRAGNAVIREIVASCFVPAEILRIQEEVIAGRRPPEY